MDSKAQATIYIGILSVVVIMSMGLIIFLGQKIFTDLNTELQSSPELSASTKGNITGIVNTYTSFSDGLILFVLSLFWIFSLIAAYYTDNNPVFFVISLVVMLFLIAASGILVDFWTEYSSDAAYSGYTTVFPITTFIMDNFVAILVGMLLSTLMVAFIKGRG